MKLIIIAEAGVNHNGNITLAKKLVDVAKNAGADIVYHDLFLVRSRSGKSWFWKRPHSRQLSQPVFGDLLYFGNPIFNSSVVVKRVLMNKICGF